jgi:cytoplasmic iron level regulating protein YaaA (DUF328/UPF0246 family)
MSYLITCSKAKVKPSQTNPSSLNNLSFPQLNFNRQLLINCYQIQKQTILDWNKCLPAWQLYSGTGGRIYPRVNNNNWTNLNTDVKILSALFGWIKHTDLIPYYDLKIDEKIIINNQLIPVNNYWRNNINLNQDAFINPNDIDLLSTVYRKALNRTGNSVAITPNVNWNDKHGYHKGVWLNSELELIR